MQAAYQKQRPEKTCSKCRNKGTFAVNKHEPDGLQKWCNVCRKRYAAEYYKKNKSKISERCAKYRSTHKDQYKAYEKVSEARYPGLTLWRHAQSRAKKKGLPFDIKPTDIIIPERCRSWVLCCVPGRGKFNPAHPRWTERFRHSVTSKGTFG